MKKGCFVNPASLWTTHTTSVFRGCGDAHYSSNSRCIERCKSAMSDITVEDPIGSLKSQQSIPYEHPGELFVFDDTKQSQHDDELDKRPVSESSAEDPESNLSLPCKLSNGDDFEVKPVSTTTIVDEETISSHSCSLTGDSFTAIEERVVRTEEGSVEETTPVLPPPPSFGPLCVSSVCADDDQEKLDSSFGALNAHCYFENSTDDKQSSLPSLQWSPPSSSTQSGAATHRTDLPISGNSSGNVAVASDRAVNSLQPVMATPIHETTLFHARVFKKKKIRGVLLGLFCFLFIIIVLSLALGFYFGMRRCSNVCYGDVSSSIDNGWSPDLCPLAGCYPHSRIKFMSYWHIWCSINANDLRCSEFDHVFYK